MINTTWVDGAEGERLHVVISGAGPPVLLLSGLGGAWFDWDRVVPLLAGYTVVAMDRPGLGRSAPARRLPTLAGEVARIAAVAARLPAPVLLVAHSLAGWHAEAYARTHPEQVAGVVLVDPSVVDRPPWLWPLRAAPWLALRPLARPAAAGGLGPRVRAGIADRQSLCGDPADPALIAEVYGRPDTLRAVVGELATFARLGAALVRLRGATAWPPPVPLRVLTALAGAARRTAAEQWLVDQRRLAASAPDGTCVPLADSAHQVMWDRPDAVADAVRAVSGRRYP
ncbi:MAG: alpha/beta fold hydrolase [Mycobacteriales bacterium]